jgi:hypothetical protein
MPFSLDGGLPTVAPSALGAATLGSRIRLDRDPKVDRDPKEILPDMKGLPASRKNYNSASSLAGAFAHDLPF